MKKEILFYSNDGSVYKLPFDYQVSKERILLAMNKFRKMRNSERSLPEITDYFTKEREVID